MTYINQISLVGLDGKLRHVGELFNTWRDNYGPEWNLAADATNRTAYYAPLRENGLLLGRLTATLTNIVRPELSERALLLDLTVQGPPLTQDLDGVAEFHNASHRAIVNYFAGVTTSKAHKEWGRIQ
jgi:hypothetical protein